MYIILLLRNGRSESLLDLAPFCAELPAREETSADPRHLRGAGSKQPQQQQQRGRKGARLLTRRETRDEVASGAVAWVVALVGRGRKSPERIPRERNDPSSSSRARKRHNGEN